MYHAIVRAVTRSLWRRIARDGFDVAVDKAAPDVRFTFVGDTELGGELTGREALRDWFARATRLLPGLTITPVDIAVAGPPWNTRVAVRLAITDGADYHNVGAQWIRLRWGRMTDDWVLEDTLRLARQLQTAPATR